MNFRGNPAGAAHLDRVSVVLAAFGVVWWLRARGRTVGLFLVGTFAMLHVPAILAEAATVPSVSRTVAAAPFAYLFVATGTWWLVSWVQRFSRIGATALATCVVALIAGVNLHRYASDYLPGLPYHNTPIATYIADFANDLPDDVAIRLVGVGWSERGMPEVKSVRYQTHAPDRVVEDDPAAFDCAFLASVERPALLVWSYADALPSPPLAACSSDLIGAELHLSDQGRPVFHSMLLQ